MQDLSRRHVLTALGALAATAALRPASSFAAQSGGEALTFLAVGDWGIRGADAQRQVAAAMARTAELEHAQFILSLGDNFYTRGVASVTDPHWRESFESVYTAPSLQVPWYPVLGNHDRNGVAMAQVAYSQVSGRWRMPGPYFWHGERLADGSKVDFFFLDTPLIVEENSGIHGVVHGDDADDQLAWLDQALSASQARWKIVVGHHPIYSGGPHGGSPEMLAIVNPMLQKYGVHAYLSGHDHNMQHIVMDNIHYVINGAGATLKPTQAIAGTAFHAETLGFLRAAMTPAMLEIAFIDVAGKTLHTVAIPYTV